MSNAVSSLQKVNCVEIIKFDMFKWNIYLPVELTDEHSKKCATDEATILNSNAYI